MQTAATVITGLGNAGAPIATAFAVLRSGGDAGDVGWTAAARLLPTVLFLLIGGALADRLPRHRVMVAANALNAVSQAALAVLVLCGTVQLWQLLVLAAAGGTGQAFYSPAAQGVILGSVDRAHAARAFAVFRIAVNAAQIGGAALGGALVAAVGPGWVLAADAAGFAAAAGLRTLLDAPARQAAPQDGGMLRDLLDGWREFASRRWLWAVVVQFSVVNACLIATEAVLGPIVADDRLGGARPWGLALAASGIGMVAGGLLMVRWRPRRILLAGNAGVFLFALPSAALAAGAPLPLLAAAMFAAGLGAEVFGVNWMVALQQEIPEEKTARVAAYDWLGSVALTPVGTAVAGPATVALGLDGTLWTATALCLALTVLVLATPEVRRLSRTRTSTPAPASSTPAAAG
nr:MFS transporter [Peterkaempfera bronchialis]